MNILIIKIKTKEFTVAKMKQSYNFYCPIIGKSITMKGELYNDAKRMVSFGEKKGICQSNSKICQGNCTGCSLI